MCPLLQSTGSPLLQSTGPALLELTRRGLMQAGTLMKLAGSLLELTRRHLMLAGMLMKLARTLLLMVLGCHLTLDLSLVAAAVKWWTMKDGLAQFNATCQRTTLAIADVITTFHLED